MFPIILLPVELRSRQTVPGETIPNGEPAPEFSKHWGVSWRYTENSIFFNSQHAGNAYQQDIFTIHPQTKFVTRLTRDGGNSVHFAAPAISPDGRKIASLRRPDREPIRFDLVLMNADGSRPSRLLATKTGTNMPPRWFPDGNSLVVSAGTGPFRHVYRIFADGGTPRQLTRGEWQDIEPDAATNPLIHRRTAQRR